MEVLQEEVKVSHQKILEFEEKLVSEKEWITKANKSGKKIFKLNISGITVGFELSKDLLCKIKGSHLEAMFSGRHRLNVNEQGQVVLDRDPILFKYIIDFLRFNHMKTIFVKDEKMKTDLQQEFDYWCIEPEVTYITDKELEEKQITKNYEAAKLGITEQEFNSLKKL